MAGPYVTEMTLNTPAGSVAGDLLIASFAITYAPSLGVSDPAPGANQSRRGHRRRCRIGSRRDRVTLARNRGLLFRLGLRHDLLQLGLDVGGLGVTNLDDDRFLTRLDRLIDALANRDFSLVLIICALTGTLQWFLWALAVGVNLFWLSVLGLARQAQRTGHG